jgi:quercetin dioxygenase-like cupin family protein
VSRRPTPRPTYDSPALLPADSYVRHLWGNDESGFVGDEVLISSETLHALIFTLPPGHAFGHSPENRTIFAADEIYYVLEGVLALANPETGQVVRAEQDEAVFFRRDTWHHGFNRSSGATRVLEFFSPPPATGSSSAYAATRPYLAEPRYDEPEVIGNWPMHRQSVEAGSSLHLLRSTDRRLRLEGAMQVGVLCSTEFLTVTDNELLPGDRSEQRCHAGDALLLVTAGVLHVHTPGGDGPNWWRVSAGDSFAVPSGSPYRLFNQSGDVATCIIGSAPGYLQ